MFFKKFQGAEPQDLFVEYNFNRKYDAYIIDILWLLKKKSISPTWLVKLLDLSYYSHRSNGNVYVVLVHDTSSVPVE